MILVVGEALIDLLPRQLADDPVLRPVPGGSPYNVAMALARLGRPVRFLCRLSTDALGARLSRRLVESGVDLAWCPRTSDLTTLGLVTLDEATGSARYAFYTQGTAGCALTEADLPARLPDEVRFIHAGSFSLAVEPCGSAIEKLIERETGNRLLSLDPNIRPFLISDRATFLARYRRIVPRIDVIKLSHEDLDWLYPGKSLERAVGEYLEAGISLVVVTQGAAGATGWTARQMIAVKPPPVTVVDTIGAGDTFQAALLAGLEHRGIVGREGLRALSAEDLRSLLSYAAGAAAITCTRAGCDPPWHREHPFPE